MRSILFSTVIAALLCVAPAVSRAQDSDDAEVTRMAKEHYKVGLDAFKAGKHDVAIKELKKAYLLKRLPALLLNIGATYRKMGDHDLATHFYRKYLDEVPATAPDRSSVQEIIGQIKIEKETGATAAVDETPAQEQAQTEAPAVPDGPKPTEWAHRVIDAAPPEMPMDVRVSAPVMKGVKVFVFYRQEGEESFKPVLMKRRGNEKIGRVPSDAMEGKALQYYIEARDAAGTVVNSAGSQANPNVVMIDPGARPQVVLASIDSSHRPTNEAVPEMKETPEDEGALKTSRDLDEEAAPVTTQMDEESSRRHVAKRKFGKLFWAGVGAGAVGLAALGTGIAGNLQAQRYANALSSDSRSLDPTGQPFRFDDPNEPANDHSFEQNGKMWSSIGIAGIVVGATLAVGGAALIAYDQWFKGYLAKREKAKRKKQRVDTPPPNYETTNFYLAPSIGPRQVGVGGGFSF